MRNRWTIAAAGPVAAAAGLAVGHLVAALTDPAASPALAVGSTVVDLTPTPVKEWAVARFGTADKPILVGSVVAMALTACVAAGFLARARWLAGAAALATLAGVAAVCAATRPQASPVDVLPSLAAGVTGVVVLRLSLAQLLARHREVADATRRSALAVLGVTLAASTGVFQLGRWLTGYRSRAEEFALPAAADPAAPLPAGLDRLVPGITPFRTPATRFYRVDTRLDVPVLDTADWTLRVDGDVRRPFTIDFDELLAMPLIERDITLTCVSNSVGGPYAGGARWLGVRLTDLLDRAGVGSRADQILSTDFAGMTISTPLGPATDGRDALVAVGMNGAPLPREHGFPARLVIPGLYGFVSATKWLARLTLTTYAEQTAYWTDRGWATDAPIKISSRIDTPRPLARLAAGEVVVGGIAWAQQRGGAAYVEVQVDGGPWTPARLGPSAGDDYWRQWFHPWTATPGTHVLACRVTDGTGAVQSAVRADPFPSGASGIHTIRVTVA